jgi:predicted nucleotidyltransferase
LPACQLGLSSLVVTSLDLILDRLRNHEADLRKLGALRLGIFGSFARGEQRQGSDLDVLVELAQRTLDRFMGIRPYLEDLLGLPIDLVQADRILPELRERVLSELIDAA